MLAPTIDDHPNLIVLALDVALPDHAPVAVCNVVLAGAGGAVFKISSVSGTY